MDKEDWCAAVHGVAKSWIWLSDWTNWQGVLCRYEKSSNMWEEINVVKCNIWGHMDKVWMMYFIETCRERITNVTLENSVLPGNWKAKDKNDYAQISYSNKFVSQRSSVLKLCMLSWIQLLSRVRLFATPWIIAHQASLSITNSQSSLRLTSIE